MKAMILAAGRGSRLKPLTDSCPKPLVKVNGKPLIEYHIENLLRAGVKEIVVNICYLGHLIKDYLKDGSRWGVSIQYSEEVTPLEVGGGVCQALPMLGRAPFIIVNADIWTDYAFSRLPKKMSHLAHLVLVPNPPDRLGGDFNFNRQNFVVTKSKASYKPKADDFSMTCLRSEASAGKQHGESICEEYTYAGIAVLTPELFLGCRAGEVYYLKMLMDKATEQKSVLGELYQGVWTDVGTLDRLYSIEKMLEKSAKWRE